MRFLFVTVCVVALAGCGVEVATTAATSAAVKKQQVDAAQQTKEIVQKKIDGRKKMAAKLKDINPAIDLAVITEFIQRENC